MINKQSISVYNPENPLEKAVQEVYHAISGRWTTMGETLGFIESMVAYDGLYDDFLSHPEAVCREIFSDRDGDKLCIPCHIVELRQILRKRKIVSNYKIAAIHWKSATRLFSEYPVLLVLDTKKIIAKPLYTMDGIVIFDKVLDFGSALIRVMCQDRFPEAAHAVDEVVQQEYPTASSHSLTNVPGLAMPKAAQAEWSNLHKFIVNISALGIKDRVIKSTDPERAVQEALAQEKQHNPDAHPNDPKYTVEYWKQTPYWPFLVRQAAAMPMKMAQNSGDIPISLSPQEQKIFNFIMAVNEKYRLGLTFRVAGGWVRDKALGKESDDIDIAIDKMTGAQFGKHLQKELGYGGAVIKANPDQSKHLETMTISLFGQDIDFVNLRSEEYADNSRIPTMKFGTPEQDAFRRDLTINALFYNINTGQVEDFTGNGISDLGFRDGQRVGPVVLRTPMDPIQTFMDDPLRILRMLRFYSRYKGAELDPSSIEAMKNPEVQAALKNKVTPERILKEFNKLFAGSQQPEALRVMHETGLWQNLFGEKLKSDQYGEFYPFTMDQRNQYHVDNVFEHTLKVIREYDAILRADGAGDDERAKALMAAFLHDIGKLSPEMMGIKPTVEGIFRTYHGHEDISAQVAKSIMRGLRASNEDVEYISNIIQHHMQPHDEMSDKQMRRMIREIGRSMVRRIIQHAKADASSKPGADTSHYDSLLERANSIEQLENKKPVLPGNVLMPLFPNLRPDSGFMREINNRLQDMKDGNPNLTQEDYIAAVEQMRPEIEQMFGGYQKITRRRGPQPMQNPPKIPAAPPEPQNNMPPKQAQTWYEQMKSIGERPETADWLYGEVVLRPRYPGQKSDKTNAVLATDTGEYALRMENGSLYDDPELSRLVGKMIWAKGMKNGLTFVVSQYIIKNEGKTGDKQVERRPAKDITDFRVGDKVRHRHRGLAFSQINGVVEKIEGPLMFVKWDGIEDQEVFRLDDLVALHGILQKI